MPATNHSSTNPPSGQDSIVVKKLMEIFVKFFENLIAFIAVMSSDQVKSLLKTNPGMTTALVLMIVLYFLTTVLIVIHEHRIRNFLPILVMLVLGTVASGLALSIISSTIAVVTLPLWLCIIALFVYCNRGEFYQVIAAAFPERFRNFIQRENLRNPPSLPV